MEIRYNATGSKRKELVRAIETATCAKAKYLGAPTMAYEIDYFTVARDGTLTFDDRADSEEVEAVLEAIGNAGFEPEEQKETGLTIEIPFDNVNCGNLLRLLEAKGSLIKKALGVDDIRIEMLEDRVGFPWFEELPSPDEVKAYSEFICKLCAFTVNAKRITVTEKETDNEKYAFRCFLLRLGFIGEEYKLSRKILLRNLEGSSAFKSGRKYAPGLDPIPTPENTVKVDVDEAMRRLQMPKVQDEIRAILNGEDGEA